MRTWDMSPTRTVLSAPEPEAEPEPATEPEGEPEPDSEPEAESGWDAEPEAEPELDAEPEPEPVPQPDIVRATAATTAVKIAPPRSFIWKNLPLGIAVDGTARMCICVVIRAH